MIIPDLKYSFCDLQIVPERVTDIESRSECNCYYEDEMLPVFTAPMDSVCDNNNYKKFFDNKIHPIIHRNVVLKERIKLTLQGLWCAYSFSEFEDLFVNGNIYQNPEFNHQNTLRALIDVANGHMKKIFTLAKQSKETAQQHQVNLILMSGNIANPKTYIDYCAAGIDYVRCSIGTGSCCLTTANAACGFPNASLIDEIRKIKKEVVNLSDYPTVTKIIADGGIRNYSDVIIALALGADYVMVGGLFSSFLESCAPFIHNMRSSTTRGFYGVANSTNKLFNGKKAPLGFYTFFVHAANSDIINEYKRLAEKYNIQLPGHSIYYTDMFEITLSESVLFNNEEIARFIVKNIDLYKSARGMSTKEAQIGNILSRGETVDYSKLKTSEGKTISKKVEYTVKQWTDNLTHYLKSEMSYQNARTLEEFIGEPMLVVKSYGTQMSVNK